MTNRIDLLDSFDRVRASVQDRLSEDQLEEFIVRNLRLGGRTISFKNREYQQRILKSDAHTIVVKKCSQVGISELMLLRNLALMSLREPFNIIHALPTSVFAQKISRTRVDPLLQGSPYLAARVNKALDNASVKQIGHSFLYLNGTYGGSATSSISIPADLICVDEVDFCDPEVVSNLQSRLTASSYRGWAYVSTPTLPNYGVDGKFNGSRRYFNHCRCNHCGDWFIPNWLRHTKIPGYSGELLGINTQMLGQIAWSEAKLHCPHCGAVPDLSPEHREWVCENPLDSFEADGFMISPMDAPGIISPADLVLWSTRFKNKNNFINYHLGETAQSADSGINETDLDRMEYLGLHPLRGFKVFGLDIGTTCHLTVGVTDGLGKVTAIELHQIRYTELEEQLRRLVKLHRPTTIVADSQPYVETIHRLQQTHHNLYGAVYVASKNLEAFRVVNKVEDKQRALLDVRQVNINRNLAFNTLMDDIRAGNIGVAPSEDLPIWRTQMVDMKRKPQGDAGFTGEAEGSDPDAYAWVKTSGNDHYHHSLLYCHVAAQMVHHLPEGRISLPPFIGHFRVK